MLLGLVAKSMVAVSGVDQAALSPQGECDLLYTHLVLGDPQGEIPAVDRPAGPGSLPGIRPPVTACWTECHG